MWARARRSRDVWHEVADSSRHCDRAHRSLDGRAASGIRSRTGGVHGDRDGRGLPPAEPRRRRGAVARSCRRRNWRRCSRARSSCGSSRARRSRAWRPWLASRARRHLHARYRGTRRSICPTSIPRAAECRRSAWRFARATISPACIRTVSSAYALTRCKLQMLRLADPGFSLPAALMSDLGLGRYLGYADLPAAAAAQGASCGWNRPDHLKHGIHLIVVQSADGSLVVGDSHHYARDPRPVLATAGRCADPGRVSRGARDRAAADHRALDRHLRLRQRSAGADRRAGTRRFASPSSPAAPAPPPALRLARN